MTNALILLAALGAITLIAGIALMLMSEPETLEDMSREINRMADRSRAGKRQTRQRNPYRYARTGAQWRA